MLLYGLYQALNIAAGEFLCPLCKCLSNIMVPYDAALMPRGSSSAVSSAAPYVLVKGVSCCTRCQVV